MANPDISPVNMAFPPSLKSVDHEALIPLLFSCVEQMTPDEKNLVSGSLAKARSFLVSAVFSSSEDDEDGDAARKNADFRKLSKDMLASQAAQRQTIQSWVTHCPIPEDKRFRMAANAHTARRPMEEDFFRPEYQARLNDYTQHKGLADDAPDVRLVRDLLAASDIVGTVRAWGRTLAHPAFSDHAKDSVDLAVEAYKDVDHRLADKMGRGPLEYGPLLQPPRLEDRVKIPVRGEGLERLRIRLTRFRIPKSVEM